MSRTPSPRLDQFAELLSQDLAPHEIRDRMGLTNSGFQSLMHRVRVRLGWQAK